MRAWYWVGMVVASACVPEPEAPEEDVTRASLTYGDPGERGPFPVGVSTFELEGIGGYDPILVDVWYPALPTEEPTDGYQLLFIEVDSDVHRDVPADPLAPQELVAFSHGLGGVRFQNFTMAERLASHGYVVVAPDHPGTTTEDFLGSFGNLSEHLVYRSFTISQAVDAIFDGVIEDVAPTEERFALVGHSLGAWTSLGTSGAIIDTQLYEDVCSQDGRPVGCRIIGGLDYSEEDLEAFSKPDPRVTHTILQAPGGYYSFEPDSFSNIGPTLVMAATLDDTLPYEAEALEVWDRLGEGTDLVTLEGAGHFGFTDICVISVAAAFAPDCEGESAGFAEHELVLERSNQAVISWLGAEVGGIEAFREHLRDDEGVSWDGK